MDGISICIKEIPPFQKKKSQKDHSSLLPDEDSSKEGLQSMNQEENPQQTLNPPGP